MSRLQRLMLLNGAVVAIVTMMSTGAVAQASPVPAPSAPKQSGKSSGAAVRNVDNPVQRIKISKAVTNAAPMPITTGSFAFSGYGGDFMTGDQSYSLNYPTDAMSMETYTTARGTVLGISAGSGTSPWGIALEAPNGADLAVGRYENVAMYPVNAATVPGLSFGGQHRGCSSVRGFFEIHQIVVGAGRQIEAIDATFAQHCESHTNFAYGHVRVNVAALAHSPATIGFDAAATGDVESRKVHTGARSKAKVDGQVSCTVGGNVVVTGALKQTVGGTPVSFPAEVISGSCAPGKNALWRVDNTVTTSAPLQGGAAQANAQVTVYDPYAMTVVVHQADDSTSLVPHGTSAKVSLSNGSFRLGGDFSSLDPTPAPLGLTYAAASMNVWSDGTYVYLDVAQTGGRKWDFYLATVGSNKLAVGKYSNVTDFNPENLHNVGTAPGLGLYINGNRCWIKGSFEVHQIAYNPDGSLSGIDATFAHECADRVVYGHLLVNMNPLRDLMKLTGDVTRLDGFSKRTAYGMNNGGNLYGYITCTVAGQVKLTGTVVENYATVPFSTTINCTTGTQVQWRVFGTQLNYYGFTRGNGTADITLTSTDPYLAAYRIGLIETIPVYL